MPAKWFVLKCSGGYLGTIWEGNSSGGLVRPRTAIVPELNPPPYHFVTLAHGDQEVRQKVADAERILSVMAWPVPVEFEGRGRDARIVEVTQQPRK